MSIDAFASRVLTWFEQHGRKDLPWQKDPAPYRVWISEIMLQQTQVATVVPYYERFMASFPDVQSLADADIDDVLHYWSGLGYYARARNLHKTARIICDEHGGEFPADFDTAVGLPGIGRSTAGAILALARNERHAILDGNVKRVLARYHAVDGWPGRTAVASKLWALAGQHAPDTRAAEYTQAIMDLGATVCTRSKPRCNECPLESDCAAHDAGRETEYPGRKAKQAKPQKKTSMVLARCDNEIWLERRPASGIWGGLWSFPELDTDANVIAWCESVFSVAPDAIESLDVMRHSFTHFDLEIRPIAVRVDECSRKVADAEQGAWHDLHNPGKLGLAAPVTSLLQQLRKESTDVTNG
jgi:A/G-specific adenine glycosylase